jgi:hypothetical protein
MKKIKINWISIILVLAWIFNIVYAFTFESEDTLLIIQIIIFAVLSTILSNRIRNGDLY